MVAAYHLIWTAYGWWLPNDPRGSMSREVCEAKLKGLGELHHGRRRIKPAGRVIREFYDRAAPRLNHELLSFDDRQCRCVAEGMTRAGRTSGYTCYAAAAMPDHVHLVIREHRDRAETMIENLQTASRELLIARGFRSDEHPVRGGPGWKVFLFTRDDIRRTIRYVEQNPVKIGWPRQRWRWVTSYDGWLPGSSPCK